MKLALPLFLSLCLASCACSGKRKRVTESRKTLRRETKAVARNDFFESASSSSEDWFQSVDNFSFSLHSSASSSTSSSADISSPPKKRSKKTKKAKESSRFIVYTDNSEFALPDPQGMPPLPEVYAPNRKISEAYAPFLKDLVKGGERSLAVVYAGIVGLKFLQYELNGISEYAKADRIIASVPSEGLSRENMRELEGILRSIAQGRRVSKGLQRMLTSMLAVLNIVKQHFSRGIKADEAYELTNLLKYEFATAIPFYRHPDAKNYRDDDNQVITDWPIQYKGHDREILAFRDALRKEYELQLKKIQSK